MASNYETPRRAFNVKINLPEIHWNFIKNSMQLQNQRCSHGMYARIGFTYQIISSDRIVGSMKITSCTKSQLLFLTYYINQTFNSNKIHWIFNKWNEIKSTILTKSRMPKSPCIRSVSLFWLCFLALIFFFFNFSSHDYSVELFENIKKLSW